LFYQPKHLLKKNRSARNGRFQPQNTADLFISKEFSKADIHELFKTMLFIESLFWPIRKFSAKKSSLLTEAAI